MISLSTTTLREELAKIKAGCGRAETNHDNWRDIFQEAQMYATPNRKGGWHDDATGGDKSSTEVFDSTAVLAATKFASNTLKSMTPPATAWMKLETDDKSQKKTLAEVSEILFDAIKQSNFTLAAASAYQDLAVGTGAILCLEGDVKNPLKYTAVPLSQVFIEENAGDTIGTAYRKYEMTLDNIKKQWPNVEGTAAWKELLDGADEDSDTPKKVKLIEASLEGRWNITRTVEGKTQENIPADGYKYVVFAEGGEHVIHETFCRTNPWIIFRWEVLPGESYGRGPVLQCIQDIRQINYERKITKESQQFALNPAFILSPSIFNQVRELPTKGITPGVTLVNQDAYSNVPSVIPFPAAANAFEGEKSLKDLINRINQHFDVEPFGAIDKNTPKTATEISQRQKDFAERQGANYARLEKELLRPLVFRALDILDSLGQIDLAPHTYVNWDKDVDLEGSLFLKLKFVTPLEKANKANEINALMQFISVSTSILGEQMATTVSPRALIEKFADLLDIPKDILHSEAQQVKIASQALKLENQGGA